MFAHINELSIIVASLLSVAIGSIWYSPLVCGKIWERASQKDTVDVEFSKKQLISFTIRAVLANTILFTIIMWMYEHIQAEYPFVFVVSVASGIILIHLMFISLWEKRPIAYVCVHGGYTLLTISLGLGVILYWPW